MHHKLLSLITFLFIPTFLLAHGSHGNGVMAGFTHPIFGVDHNIAILGTGILGYLLDQKRWFLAPVAFIVAMIVGGVFGVGQEATSFIEKTIAFSVFTIGIMIILRSKLNLIFPLVILAIFGAFHGYAHGAEMDEMNSISKYIPGYTLGAALLALIGFSIAKTLLSKTDVKMSAQLIGGIIIGCGIMMLLP